MVLLNDLNVCVCIRYMARSLWNISSYWQFYNLEHQLFSQGIRIIRNFIRSHELPRLLQLHGQVLRLIRNKIGLESFQDGEKLSKLS